LEGLDSPLQLIQNPIKTESSVFQLPNVVEIITSDDEVFPVKRRLLRPCISLTSIVQAGKGKYELPTDKNNSDHDSSHNSARVPVDACTFDRILLYLEHEARHETFKFDPLIANDLLVASQSLQISGLQQLCEKILGSFQERVRKTPIRFQEVIDRNEQGRLASLDPSRNGKRGDTLLILNGMVLDITRWLDEHPGGSTIIPEQALNIDCTIFFEIYHASRQSFLYLKEFYIGEIAEEDIPNIPKGSQTNQNSPSAAFLEQLNKVTSWRLKSDELTKYVTYKSF
jgi:cytochrome b involved in lipid metabolism